MIKKNREGSAAKLFFKSLYTSSFVRFHDDITNSALNYGYKILTSRIASSIVNYGLNPALGFFHKNKGSYLNLAFDLNEPFRPIIDWIVVQNKSTLFGDELNFQAKITLIKVLDYYVVIDNKVMKVKNAIDYMIKSVISFIRNKSDTIILPEVYGNILQQESDEGE